MAAADAAPRAYRSFGEQSLKYFIRDHTEIPAAPIETPSAWLGRELRADPDAWREALQPDEIAELDAALDRIEADGLSLAELDGRGLPTLEKRAAAWRRALCTGRGFVVLTGLPVDRWGEARSSRAYWLLGHLVGIPGAQNARDELLGHVIDYGEQADQPNVRLYRTTADIGYHCDAADVVGLLCLVDAAEGGASRIASSVTIWNRLFEADPEAARLLFEPFAVDRRDEQPEGDRPFFEMPPCRFGADGVLRTFFHGAYFRSAQRLAEIGPLSPARARALDRYDAIGNDPEVRLDMALEPGDIQLLSNHTVVHARNAYREHPDRKRHLLRLWLSLPDAETAAG
ncbi:MAG: TauD/TfdA family dioxygenase [bacterium]|nr:TauD/TfdA family dioxygenase [bacterium]